MRALLFVALGPAAALAQAGRISGTVTDSAKAPMAGAQVGVVGTRHGATTDAGGRFTISGVDAGTYEVRVQRIGEQAKSVTGVVVRPGEDTRVEVTLARAPVSLAGVVVSASRRAEKITDAPATITSISTDVIDNAVGNTFAGALKEVKGLDFIQVGMTRVADQRARLQLVVQQPHADDRGRTHLGPAGERPAGRNAHGDAEGGPRRHRGARRSRLGALWAGRVERRARAEHEGPARSSRARRSRSPAAIAATATSRVATRACSATSASRSPASTRRRRTGRTSSPTTQAGTIVPSTTPGAVSEQNLKDPINWETGVVRGTGALVYYRGDQRLELSGGMSQTDGVGQTNVGRNQLRDWDYNVAAGAVLARRTGTSTRTARSPRAARRSRSIVMRARSSRPRTRR